MFLLASYAVECVSRWFVENNRDAAYPSLNGHLKLQKLLYYAQAMKLAVHGEPLFLNKIEAWENGPVVSDMFVEYRYNNFVEKVKSFPIEDYEFDDETLQILKVVNHIYGSQTGGQLVNLTHSEEPWLELKDKAMKRLNPEITKEKIETYYQPLKELFEMYEDFDFDSEVHEQINGNVFVYNKHETELNEDDLRNLWDFGVEKKGGKYFVYKDGENGLVIY